MESVNCVTANKTAVLERERTGCAMSLNRRVYDRGMRSLLWLSAGITCALLVFLMGYILWRGIPQLSWQFLTSSESVLKGTLGILPAICNTLYVVCVTLCIALPLGVGAAVYLTEYATNHKLVSAIEFAAETLSGIPSILYALVGYLAFCKTLGLGYSLLAASLAGWMLVYEGAHLLARVPAVSGAFSALGRATMPIVILHFLAFKPVTWLGLLATGGESYLLAAFPIYFTSGAWWVAYTAAGLALPLLAYAVWVRLKKAVRRG